MSSIFLKSLSAVTSGKLNAFVVAAMMVSTKKSIPFTSTSFLIFQSVKTSSQAAVKLFKGLFPLFCLLFPFLLYFVKQVIKAILRI